MKILFVSRDFSGASLCARLVREGNEVRAVVSDPASRQIFDGLVEKIEELEIGLAWVGKEGLIVVDDVGFGELQDRLRAEGYAVMGGSAGGEQLYSLRAGSTARAFTCLPNSPPDGIHHLVEFFGCCPHQINSQTFWETILAEALAGAEIQILNRHFCRFSPQGITGYFLLSASHIAIHTWPEHGYVACDIFSCGCEKETAAIVARVTAAINHQRVHAVALRRGFRFGTGSETVAMPPSETVAHCHRRCPASEVSPQSGEERVVHFEIASVNAPILRVPVKELLFASRSAHQAITICDTVQFGRCLLLDGVIQSAESDHAIYDQAILRKLRPGDHKVLILGGGDGYVAALALRLNPDLMVTVVELDAEVVDACKTHLDQRVFEHHQVELFIEDAVRFLEQAAEASWDGIVCDLTDFPVGCSGESMKEFFSAIIPLASQALKAGGWIGLYAGSKGAVVSDQSFVVDLLSTILATTFTEIESAEVLISSYGEPSNFLYARKA